jgi:hypothetical protein
MHIRRLTGVVAVLGLVLVGCSSKEAPRETTLRSDDPVRTKLATPITLDSASLPLSAFLEQVHQQAGVNFFANWPSLKAIGVEPSTPVNLHGLQGAPTSTALDIALRQIGTDPTNSVRFVVREGIVIVDTAQNLASTKDTRVYDVRDLIVVASPPTSGLAATRQEPEGMGGSGDGSKIFGDVADADDRDEVVRAKIDQLVTIIATTVDRPENWEEGGGTDSIRELNGNLIVRTTPENHRDIERLLSDLREHSKKR